MKLLVKIIKGITLSKNPVKHFKTNLKLNKLINDLEI